VGLFLIKVRESEVHDISEIAEVFEWGGGRWLDGVVFSEKLVEGGELLRVGQFPDICEFGPESLQQVLI
jgi:hypothetical protein